MHLYHLMFHGLMVGTNLLGRRKGRNQAARVHREKVKGKNIPPRCSMYGIFTYIYPKNDPNVGNISIHGAYGPIK